MQVIDKAVKRDNMVVPSPSKGVLWIIKWHQFLKAYMENYVFVWQVNTRTQCFLAATITNMMPLIVGAQSVINIKLLSRTDLPLIGNMLLSHTVIPDDLMLAIVLHGCGKYWLIKGMLRGDNRSACDKPTPQTHPSLTKKVNILCSSIIKNFITNVNETNERVTQPLNQQQRIQESLLQNYGQNSNGEIAVATGIPQTTSSTQQLPQSSSETPNKSTTAILVYSGENCNHKQRFIPSTLATEASKISEIVQLKPASAPLAVSQAPQLTTQTTLRPISGSAAATVERKKVPIPEELFKMKRNVMFRKVRLQDMNDILWPERRSEDHRWMVLDLQNDFSDIYVPDINNIMTSDRIHKLMQYAMTKNITVKLNFFGYAPYDVFATPRSLHKLYFGPLKLNMRPPDIVLLQSVDGRLMLRETFQQKHNIRKSPRECTTVFWMYQINGEKKFQWENDATIDIQEQARPHNLPMKMRVQAEDESSDNDCIIVESQQQQQQQRQLQQLEPQRKKWMMLKPRKTGQKNDAQGRYNFTIETVENSKKLQITPISDNGIQNGGTANSNNFVPLKIDSSAAQVPPTPRAGIISLPKNAVITSVAPAPQDAPYSSTIFISKANKALSMMPLDKTKSSNEAEVVGGTSSSGGASENNGAQAGISNTYAGTFVLEPLLKLDDPTATAVSDGGSTDRPFVSLAKEQITNGEINKQNVPAAKCVQTKENEKGSSTTSTSPRSTHSSNTETQKSSAVGQKRRLSMRLEETIAKKFKTNNVSIEMQETCKNNPALSCSSNAATDEDNDFEHDDTNFHQLRELAQGIEMEECVDSIERNLESNEILSEFTGTFTRRNTSLDEDESDDSASNCDEIEEHEERKKPLIMVIKSKDEPSASVVFKKHMVQTSSSTTKISPAMNSTAAISNNNVLKLSTTTSTTMNTMPTVLKLKPANSVGATAASPNATSASEAPRLIQGTTTTIAQTTVPKVLNITSANIRQKHFKCSTTGAIISLTNKTMSSASAGATATSAVPEAKTSNGIKRYANGSIIAAINNVNTVKLSESKTSTMITNTTTTSPTVPAIKPMPATGTAAMQQLLKNQSIVQPDSTVPRLTAINNVQTNSSKVVYLKKLVPNSSGDCTGTVTVTASATAITNVPLAIRNGVVRKQSVGQQVIGKGVAAALKNAVAKDEGDIEALKVSARRLSMPPNISLGNVYPVRLINPAVVVSKPISSTSTTGSTPPAVPLIQRRAQPENFMAQTTNAIEQQAILKPKFRVISKDKNLELKTKVADERQQLKANGFFASRVPSFPKFETKFIDGEYFVRVSAAVVRFGSVSSVSSYLNGHLARTQPNMKQFLPTLWKFMIHKPIPGVVSTGKVSQDNTLIVSEDVVQTGKTSVPMNTMQINTKASVLVARRPDDSVTIASASHISAIKSGMRRASTIPTILNNSAANPKTNATPISTILIDD